MEKKHKHLIEMLAAIDPAIYLQKLQHELLSLQEVNRQLKLTNIAERLHRQERERSEGRSRLPDSTSREEAGNQHGEDDEESEEDEDDEEEEEDEDEDGGCSSGCCLAEVCEEGTRRLSDLQEDDRAVAVAEDGDLADIDATEDDRVTKNAAECASIDTIAVIEDSPIDDSAGIKANTIEEECGSLEMTERDKNVADSVKDASFDHAGKDQVGESSSSGKAVTKISISAEVSQTDAYDVSVSATSVVGAIIETRASTGHTESGATEVRFESKELLIASTSRPALIAPATSGHESESDSGMSTKGMAKPK